MEKILFTDDPSRIFVVPADGGTPRQLMPEDRPNVIGAGAWLPDGNSILFVRVMGCHLEDRSCISENSAIYLLDLKTQRVSKLPGSEKMFASRLSLNGRYVSAVFGDPGKLMLYDFQTKKWAQLANEVGSSSGVWSHDSKFVYLDLKGQAAKPTLVRISVPDGKVEPALDLSDITLGGYSPRWIGVLPDDSPLFVLDRSKHEIYRLELQYR
jgi:Tol biopolymer transport system component